MELVERLERFEVVIELCGPEKDLDEHLNWVRELASLSEHEIEVEVEPSNTARVSVVFHAACQTDAVFMGVGMIRPGADSPVHVKTGQVNRLSA